MVLIRDIWTPIVGGLLSTLPCYEMEIEPNGNLVLLIVLLCMVPFVVQYELHALRYNCYIGFSSMSVLCVALWYRAMTQEEEDETTATRYEEPAVVPGMILDTTPKSLGDVIFVSPIIVLSFLSHFNVLPIQGALVKPSRIRIRSVIDRAVGAAFLLMYLLGLGGYLCFGANTQGNILLNLSQEMSSPLILLGRIGCGITIVLALAMMTLPCRRNVLELLDCWIEYRKSRSRFDGETAWSEIVHGTVSAGEARRLLPVDFRHQHSLDERVHLAKNPMAHFGSTFLIILGCYLGAVAAPGVAIVWNLCGSFMAYLIGFILPTACYLELQRKVVVFPPDKKNFGWRIISWILLLLSIVAAVACTSETAVTLFHEGVR
jgi:amino acid permease